MAKDHMVDVEQKAQGLGDDFDDAITDSTEEDGTDSDENDAGSTSEEDEEMDGGHSEYDSNDGPEDTGLNLNPWDFSSLLFATVDELEKFHDTYCRDGSFFRQYGCREQAPGAKRICGCRTGSRVFYDTDTGNFKVTRCEHVDNHSLGTHEPAHWLSYYRYLIAPDKLMMNLLQWLGVRPSQVSDPSDTSHAGEWKPFLGFEMNDGHSYSNQQKFEIIKGGEINKALSYLECMKLTDHKYVFEYAVSENGALDGIFWRDTMSLEEFKLFSDVLIVDRAHVTNTCRFPLVIFSGINNHGSTCIFGAAVMYNDTLESYRWLLKTFRNSMNGKMPGLVLTDQFPSMRHAVFREFPGVRHRFCSWHLARNARANLSDHDHFLIFLRLMQKRCSVAEYG